MSTTADSARGTTGGIPELTVLGRHMEMLRLDRGLSKQGLARDAGTSRQQLWRVMTGKSELTTALCERLAEVLGIEARSLRNPERHAHTSREIGSGATDSVGRGRRGSRSTRSQQAATAPTVAEYLADPRWIARTLATCPGGSEGRLLKRRLLDGLEDAAREAGVKLPPSFFIVRGRVVNGEL